MANHKKYSDATMTTIVWDRGDILYLDSVRGKMSRGEYLSGAMHLSAKDRELLTNLSSQIRKLKEENAGLMIELRELKVNKHDAANEIKEKEIKDLRSAFLRKNRDVILRTWNIDGGLNWVKITHDLKFSNKIEAKEWFEAHLGDVIPVVATQNDPQQIELLHPGCVVRGKDKMESD